MERYPTDGPAFGRYEPADPEPTVSVQLRDVPVRIWKRSSEHHDELMRELALLALAPSTAHDLPRRLIELVDVLGRQYGGVSDRPEAERDAALTHGVDRIDVSFDVPPSAADAAAALGALLREVEEYCRDGELLLTLAPSREQADFNAWYLHQIISQISGAAPEPWQGPWD